MKRLGAIISILVSFVIGISLMESIPNLMNAANDDNPWGEPIVDFIYGQSPSCADAVRALSACVSGVFTATASMADSFC